MSLGRKVFAAPARLWMNWPFWGGLLAMLLLAKHAWVLFAPVEHAVPGTTAAAQSAQAEQLIGIFASSKNGFAVMQTESGQIGVGVGGQVAPGVRLVETHPDYVVLERNGVRQRADLSKAPAAAGDIIPAGNAAPAPGTQAQILNRFTPEQKAILQQQQQALIRGID